MAAADRGTSGPVTPAETPKPAAPAAVGDAARPPSAVRHRREPTVEERLFSESYAFSFFQSVRLLEKLAPDRMAVGRNAPPSKEVVRFRPHLSLSFPPSQIFDIRAPGQDSPIPLMSLWFFGLTGASGALPRHYTELLLRIEREGKGLEKRALRDWLDLFNHRLISLFYRSWEKYRFYIPFERGEYAVPEPDALSAGRAEPDAFTRGLFSLVGLGMRPLRDRLQVAVVEEIDGLPAPRTLARVDDLALLHYGGFLAQRPRNAVSLAAMLREYFAMPATVQQFHGHWLRIDPENQSRPGASGANHQLGVNLVAGERVWDIQGKFRIRIGPLDYRQFNELLPDRAPASERKVLFLLSHLVRLYVGPEFAFDVQVVLRAADVPACQLGGTAGSRLGWNSWIRTEAMPRDAADAVFQGDEVFAVSA